MLTENQLDLIAKVKSLGYGYQSFAISVESQGWCSEKQEDTLRKLLATGIYRKNNWRSSYGSPIKKSLAYKHDISDCEAMSFGEYF